MRFDDVFVEENLRLGAEGAGYGIALSNLEAGRIGIASQCIGMAQAGLEIAVAYARERKSFGKPTLEHQAVGCRLANLAARPDGARTLGLQDAATRGTRSPSQ